MHRVHLSLRHVIHAIMGLWLWLATGTAAAAGDSQRCLLADGFDYPVGKPDGSGYYKFRGFTPNGHLGEDWNGRGGGDSDLGDPIYNIAHGVVILSENVHQGWGNCIIVRHAYRDDDGQLKMVDSLYGHLHERKSSVGDVLQRGQLLGTMGSNFGQYAVHLHFEIRKNLQIGMNRSAFARDYSNYYSPTAFINAHRSLPAGLKMVEIPLRGFGRYAKPGEGQSAAGAYPTLKAVSTGYRIPVYKADSKPNPGLRAPSFKGDPNSALGRIRNETNQRNQSTPTVPGAPGVTVKKDFWGRLKERLGAKGKPPVVSPPKAEEPPKAKK
jgi:murein DD-endopeptidase MepM/ murein hydrolase activator NlpD